MVRQQSSQKVLATLGLALGLGFAVQVTARAQSPAPAHPMELTALDYVQIQQLVAGYAQAIDTCSNNGYDYADLFAPDGYFAPYINGKVGAKWQGRERLAEASGGGSLGCKDVHWIQEGVHHLYVNHIITPTADGAAGTVNMLMIGLDGNPNKIEHDGYYEDTYVKTAKGWRFKSRIHHSLRPPRARAAATAAAQGVAAGPVLTAEDRAAIQDLGARYARALTTCAAEDYADLFASPAGYFGSGSRGELVGRDHLMGLVRSEPRCANATADAAGRTAGPSGGNAPTVTIGQSADGVTGRTMVGTGGGYYEDVYVKTPAGWRFKSRNVLSAPEAGFRLTIQDFMAIRKLAGDDGSQFDDVYTDSASAPHSTATPGAGPGRLLRASGLVITATPEGAAGKAFLRDGGGSYDDVYVRTTNGWRFKSRVYTPGPQASGARNSTPGSR